MTEERCCQCDSLWKARLGVFLELWRVGPVSLTSEWLLRAQIQGHGNRFGSNGSLPSCD